MFKMKSEKNILKAFLLNLIFSIIEIIGGIITNSVAILSDSFHDLLDSLSIGISYFLEKKSMKKPDETFTYGYRRYSVLGAFIMTVILLTGSIVIIYHSVDRLFNPKTINYDGMLIIAIFGVIINFLAAYFTREGKSMNQKAVNLHMLEDVLGWIIILFGSIIIKFTKITWIDSVMSIGVSLFIFKRALQQLKEVLDLFLIKTPKNINIDEIKEDIMNIEGVIDVHHIHVWSLDNINVFSTIHVVTDKKNKKKIKEKMKKYGIKHVTVEIEDESEHCNEKKCEIELEKHHHHHH